MIRAMWHLLAMVVVGVALIIVAVNWPNPPWAAALVCGLAGVYGFCHATIRVISLWRRLWAKRKRYTVDGVFMTQGGQRITYRMSADEPHANHSFGADGIRIELTPKPPKPEITIPQLLRELWGP